MRKSVRILMSALTQDSNLMLRSTVGQKLIVSTLLARLSVHAMQVYIIDNSKQEEVFLAPSVISTK